MTDAIRGWIDERDALARKVNAEISKYEKLFEGACVLAEIAIGDTGEKWLTWDKTTDGKWCIWYGHRRRVPIRHGDPAAVALHDASLNVRADLVRELPRLAKAVEDALKDSVLELRRLCE